MAEGWIKLYWKTTESLVGTSAVATGIWAHLLLRAAVRKRVLRNGQILNPGEVMISEVGFAADLDVSRKVMRRVLNLFAESGMIEVIKRDRNGTKLSISNWGAYQDFGQPKGQQRDSNETATNIERDSNEHQTENPKIPKSPKKPKREGARFLRPSIQDIQEFARAASLADLAPAFHDYYESNGWRVGRNPMKDWRAAYRGWCKRENGFTPKSQPAKELKF